MKELAVTIRVSESRSFVVEVDEPTYSALLSSPVAGRANAVSVLERGDRDPTPVGDSDYEVVGVDLIDPATRDTGDVVLYAEEQP